MLMRRQVAVLETDPIDFQTPYQLPKVESVADAAVRVTMALEQMRVYR